jgi:hypothetical protein
MKHPSSQLSSIFEPKEERGTETFDPSILLHRIPQIDANHESRVNRCKSSPLACLPGGAHQWPRFRPPPRRHAAPSPTSPSRPWPVATGGRRCGRRSPKARCGTKVGRTPLPGRAGQARSRTPAAPPGRKAKTHGWKMVIRTGST